MILNTLGLLAFCLDYGQRTDLKVGGVFKSVREQFSQFNDSELYNVVNDIKDFRNNYIAHQEKELTDKEMAQDALKSWIEGLLQIYRLHHN